MIIDHELNVEARRLFANLKGSGMTLATAESLTGGLVASTLTEVPGISQFFKGGAITYCDAEKVRALGVKQETLDKYTAVSEFTAQEMATGIRTACTANIGISTTGYAGPGAGPDGTPAGTFCIGVTLGRHGQTPEEYTRTFQHPNQERDEVRWFAAFQALRLVNELLEEHA